MWHVENHGVLVHQVYSVYSIAGFIRMCMHMTFKLC